MCLGAEFFFVFSSPFAHDSSKPRPAPWRIPQPAELLGSVFAHAARRFRSLLDPERFVQITDKLLASLRVHLCEILDLPLNGGEFFNVWNAQQFPLRLSLFS